MKDSPPSVENLAKAVFAAYSRNSGNGPDLHYDRQAAEAWMAEALKEAGVSRLIEAAISAERALGDLDGVAFTEYTNLCRAIESVLSGAP